MRLLRAAWKTLVIVGVLAFAATAFVLARQLKGLLTEAAPTAGNSGPASVDGLLNGLADTMTDVASGIGAGSANPIRQSADQLRSLQREIGGAQKGFDKLSGALDLTLGGAPDEAKAVAADAPPVHVPVRKPVTESPSAQNPAAQKPATQTPATQKPAAHRPTRIE